MQRFDLLGQFFEGGVELNATDIEPRFHDLSNRNVSEADHTAQDIFFIRRGVFIGLFIQGLVQFLFIGSFAARYASDAIGQIDQAQTRLTKQLMQATDQPSGIDGKAQVILRSPYLGENAYTKNESDRNDQHLDQHQECCLWDPRDQLIGKQ